MGGSLRRSSVVLLCMLAMPASAEENWFQRIRYGVGVGVSGGGGVHARAPTGLAEGASLEFRSYFTPELVSHTTLNVSRMVAFAALGEPRIDYDLHFGPHIPLSGRVDLLLLPGAAIAYAPGKLPYERFVADLRLGVDLRSRAGGATVGIYARPFAGWMVTRDGTAGATGGGLLEVVFVAHLRKRDQSQSHEGN